MGGVQTMVEHVEDPERIAISVALAGGILYLVSPVGDIIAMVERVATPVGYVTGSRMGVADITAMMQVPREVATLLGPVGDITAMVEVPGGGATLVAHVGDIMAMVEVLGGVTFLVAPIVDVTAILEVLGGVQHW